MKRLGYNSNTQTELKNFIQKQVLGRLLQILRLKDFLKNGNIVTYQTDHTFLLCEYLVINTLMLFHQRIILVQIRCMWLITIITFDKYNIVSNLTINFYELHTV